MNIIDLKNVSNHFKRSITTYDEDALVQKAVSVHLISLLDIFPHIHFERVLEIGCCTGSMTELLCQNRSINHLWLNDLVKECTQVTAERVGSCVGKTRILNGDIGTITLPENLDMIISSSTFQWLEDLPGCFERFSNALNDNGYLVFSAFSKGTMQQVRELLGIGLSYKDERELSEILEPHFSIGHIQTTDHRMYLQTPREVLRHIQKTGVGGAGNFRWTPKALRKFESEYIRKFGSEQGVSLDYVSVSVIAKKKQGV